MSLSLQFLSLLAMIGTGIVTAAFIDMIGTGTASLGKKSFIRKYASVFEVFGWLVAGCWTFWVLYIIRDGAWRIYDPFAQLSGIFLYASLFHKPIRLAGRIFLTLLLKPIWFIFYLLISVFWRILYFIMKSISFFLTPVVKTFRMPFRKRFEKEVK